MNFLKLGNMSIKLKIALGFALPVFLIILFAVVTIMSVIKSERQKRIARYTDQIRIHELLARQHEEAFLLKRDLSFVEKHGKSIDEIQSRLKTLYKFQNTGEERQLLDSLKASIESYEKIFLKVVAYIEEKGLDEESGLQAATVNAVASLEKYVQSNTLSPEVVALIYRCRLQEKAPQSFTQVVNKLKSILKARNATKLLALVNTYQATVSAIQSIDKKIQDDMILFDKEIDKLAPLLETVYTAANTKAGKSSQALFRNLAIIALVEILLCVGIAFFLIQVITKPFDELMALINALGKGDLTKQSTITTKDEIGKMAAATDGSMKALKSVIEQIATHSLVLTSSSEELSAVASQVASSTEEMSSQSTTIATSTEEASTNMNSIASSTEDMTTAISMVATAIEEMSATVNEISKNCQKELQIAGQANTQANATNEMMKKLERSANEIGKVLGVIKDIADKTNLLALNATIEAASAGEAGKGFAVVANEVKELANQTSQATDEIGKQINDMYRNTTSSVKAIGDISDIVAEVNAISETIVSAIEEQSATINEISNNVSGVNNSSMDVSRNVQESAKGLNEISSNIAGFNNAIREITTGMTQVDKSTNELTKIAAKLNQSVEAFRV